MNSGKYMFSWPGGLIMSWTARWMWSPLDVPPNGGAVGADHHATAHRRVIGELGTAHHAGVPAVEVLALRRDPLLVGHGRAVYVRTPSRSLSPTGSGLPPRS